MSAPTPAKRRQNGSTAQSGAGAKDNNNSDGGRAILTTRRELKEFDWGEPRNCAPNSNDREARTGGAQTATTANSAEEKIFVNSQVNAKIGHFERLSLADQRLLLLSAAHQQQQSAGSNGWQDSQQQQQQQQQASDLEKLPVEDQQLMSLGGARSNCDQQHYLVKRLYVGEQGQFEHDEEELCEEVDEEYLGLDTIIEEDEENVNPEQITSGDNINDCDKIGTNLFGGDGNADAKSAANAQTDHTARLVQHNKHAEAEELLLSSSVDCFSSSPTNEEFSLAAVSNRINEECQQKQAKLLEVSQSGDNSKANGKCSSESQQQQQQQQHLVAREEETSKSINMEEAKEAISSKRQQQQQTNPLLLPSTNRLISEHQARQQQATLFRVLTERQRLLDELAPDERLEQADLMSGHFHSFKQRADGNVAHRARQLKKQTAISTTTIGEPGVSSSQQQQQQQRRCRRRAHSSERVHKHHTTVPLSAVDLSSMSDRQLDELLGRIASVSSSSSSASCSSSSSFSDTNELSSSDDEWQPASNASQEMMHAAQHARLAPSVIGVHENEQHEQHATGQRATSGAGANKCRDVHKRTRRRDSREDDDEDDKRGSGRERREPLGVHAPDLTTSDGGTGMVSPSGPKEAPLSPQLRQLDTGRTPSSVESVLSRMLEALDEATRGGRQARATPATDIEEDDEDDDDEEEEENYDDEEREHLNTLLERGFLHLEQLLSCSLAPAPGSPNAPSPARQTLSTVLQQSTLASQKDSDYGSDTQSAVDCFSSPSQLEPGTTSANSKCNLSPLAIELSFKLAESLRALAQRQHEHQQRRQERQMRKLEKARKMMQAEKLALPSSGDNANTARANGAPSDDVELRSGASSCSAGSTRPRRAPMRSIVMINSPELRPASSCATGVDSPTQGNMTPDDCAGHARLRTNEAAYRTRVSINGSSSASCSSASPAPQAAQASAQTQATGADFQAQQDTLQVVKVVGQSALERRRSARSSLRRRPSARREPGAPRPSSPRPQPSAAIVSADSSTLNSSNNNSQRTATIAPTSTVQQVAAMHTRQQRPSSNNNNSKTNLNQQQLRANQTAPEMQHQSTISPNVKKQRQLQRALELAQKYNFSPAKMAASKLGVKLEAATEENNHNTGVARANELGSVQAQQQAAGRVLLDISYLAESGLLTVHLIQCSQLIAANKRRETSNPYVKMYLLPDQSKSGKRKSSVKRHELDPKFDQQFTFGPIQLTDFDSRTLLLSVWHKERLGRSELLGKLSLPLAHVRNQLLAADQCQSTTAKWYLLNGARQFQQVSRVDCTTTQQATSVNGHQHQATSAQAMSKRYSSATRLEQQQAAEQVARKLNEFERKAQQLANAASGGASPSGGGDMSKAVDSLRKHQTATHAPQQQQVISYSDQIGDNMTLAPALFDYQSKSSDTVAHTIAGRLFFMLKFVPESDDPLARPSPRMHGNLLVLIKEAKNLATTQATINGQKACLPSPQCKCYLLSATGERVARQKCPQIKRTANPQWERELVFGSLRLAELAGQALEIQLVNRDSQSLGGIRLCKRAESEQNDTETCEQIASEKEAKLWSQMLQRPNTWVFGELPLRLLRPIVTKTANVIR